MDSTSICGSYRPLPPRAIQRALHGTPKPTPRGTTFSDSILTVKVPRSRASSLLAVCLERRVLRDAQAPQVRLGGRGHVLVVDGAAHQLPAGVYRADQSVN